MIDRDVLIRHAEEFLDGSPDYLVDVLINPGNVITVEIDNDSGVNIDDCIKLSRHLETKLDRDTEDFELTVTSVGLTSPFKTLRQYKKYAGKEVELLTKKGQKLSGTLKTADENGCTITVTKKVRLEGAKRKTEVQEDFSFAYDELKYTKYLIGFK
ncbi:MAG: ribosome assembly cofactor RimP [Dysgonamonadaceae bacterium]|jgi:ribosome maturation factor RimP|nr:ribosome assembly cofactor RimP [Dysgonamonadaceae bacterium]